MMNELYQEPMEQRAIIATFMDADRSKTMLIEDIDKKLTANMESMNNRFEENIHERTDVLWSFNESTGDNTVCGPIFINSVLDIGSQLITPPGLGNEVFEECEN